MDPVASTNHTLQLYTTTANLTGAYNVGALAGVLYGIQVASGVVIAMSYVASDEGAFVALDDTPSL